MFIPDMGDSARRLLAQKRAASNRCSAVEAGFSSVESVRAASGVFKTDRRVGLTEAAAQILDLEVATLVLEVRRQSRSSTGTRG